MASLGTEIGRFWQSSNSLEGNNFVADDPDFKMDPARCPTQNVRPAPAYQAITAGPGDLAMRAVRRSRAAGRWSA